MKICLMSKTVKLKNTNALISNLNTLLNIFLHKIKLSHGMKVYEDESLVKVRKQKHKKEKMNIGKNMQKTSPLLRASRLKRGEGVPWQGCQPKTFIPCHGTTYPCLGRVDLSEGECFFDGF